jgi:cell division protein FtsI/penicillin-binding protein 2
LRFGTASSAQTPIVDIYGKTGTTERKGSAQGDFDSNIMHSDGWFVGFFQCKNINYSMVVFVQDIDPSSQSGGTTAAPIFKRIATECINDLKTKK